MLGGRRNQTKDVSSENYPGKGKKVVGRKEEKKGMGQERKEEKMTR